jgi:predicted dehydrogenase
MAGKKTIGIGIIGFGNMGMAHAYSIENLRFFASELPFTPKIIGVCARSVEKSKAICERFGFECAYASEEELIADERVDVVDICTPNHMHLDTVKAARAAGKTVLCEKPLCPTYKEAMEAAADAFGCGTVFNNRHLSPIRRAKELIEEGRLGRILSFEATYLHNSCLDPQKAAGWKQSGAYGAGVLRDLGSHIIDLVYYLCGEFDSVYARKQIAFPERKGVDGESWATDADEAVYITARLKCGAVGTLHASKLICGANDDLSISVYGEHASLKFSLNDIDKLYFYDSAASGGNYGGSRGFCAIECNGRYPAPFGSFPSPKATQGWLRGHVMSMYNFLSAVNAGEQFHPSFEDGAYVAGVCECCDVSDKEGREVSLSEVIR